MLEIMPYFFKKPVKIRTIRYGDNLVLCKMTEQTVMKDQFNVGVVLAKKIECKFKYPALCIVFFFYKMHLTGCNGNDFGFPDNKLVFIYLKNSLPFVAPNQDITQYPAERAEGRVIFERKKFDHAVKLSQNLHFLRHDKQKHAAIFGTHRMSETWRGVEVVPCLECGSFDDTGAFDDKQFFPGRMVVVRIGCTRFKFQKKTWWPTIGIAAQDFDKDTGRGYSRFGQRRPLYFGSAADVVVDTHTLNEILLQSSGVAGYQGMEDFGKSMEFWPQTASRRRMQVSSYRDPAG
jgi:hypothetical protein